jgi:SAM-dependent methyltransferase
MGSADIQGELWGTDPETWTQTMETRQRPLYDAVLDRLRLAPGATLLDAGCGGGHFVSLAVERGLAAAGVDASAALIEYARRSNPAADLRVGDIEAVPFADASFDAVTAFNSIFYAQEPRAAIAELARVTAPGGSVVVTVGAGSEHSDLSRLVDRLRPLIGPPVGERPQVPVTLSDIDQMRTAMGDAGLEVLEQTEVPFAWVWPSAGAAVQTQLASGPITAAVRHSGREATAAALRGFFEERRQPDGSVRAEVVFRYALGRRPKG